jgi:hypothetical protein
VDGLLAFQIVGGVLALARVDRVLEPDLLYVVDERFDVLLVRRVVDGLGELPGVALLFEDDFALAGVLDVDLRDLVGVLGRQLDVGKGRCRRAERVRHRVVLRALLHEPEPAEENHKDTRCCVDLLFGLHGHGVVRWGSLASQLVVNRG